MSRQIVTFSPFVPYPGIDHAGGGLFQSYVEQTSELGERLLVVPDRYDDGTHVAESTVPEIHMVSEQPRRGLELDVTPLMLALLPLPETVKPGLLHALSHDQLVKERLRRADIVEYQWHHMATLLPWAKRYAPHARHVVLLYDVISLRIAREARSASGAWAARLHYSRGTARLTEWVITRLADATIVLSEKDARLLPRGTNAVVARPPVRILPRAATPPRPSTQGSGESGAEHATFIFAAAFQRKQNLEAAEWLCREVWPRIRRQLPDAELRLAGSDPAHGLDPILADTPGAVRTGYVDDLAAEYDNADVALIPLLHGAGVKLKTIEALLTATPAVSTTVGAEGIDRAGDFLTVTDAPQQFAAAAVKLATDTTGDSRQRAADGSAWAATAHGPEQFRDSILGALTPANPSE